MEKAAVILQAAGEPAAKISNQDRLRRFLYLNDTNGVYICGNPAPHIAPKCMNFLIMWKNVKNLKLVDLLRTVTAANEDPLLIRRENVFYLLASFFTLESCTVDEKLEIRSAVLKLVKSDKDLFDFIKYCTERNAAMKKQKISTSLRKIIIDFYNSKSAEELAKCVARQESYHGWTHKDLFKLCHFKAKDVGSAAVVKYAMFGIKQLPDLETESGQKIVEYLTKTHELRHTTDVAAAATLITELHATLGQVNSKLNKEEDIWSALIPEMSVRQILQSLFKFFKSGFLKNQSAIQLKIVDALQNGDLVKKSELHPVEVFIYLRFFERGGKTLDPKLLEYLKKKDIKEETLKRLITPLEPKTQVVIQTVNRCLKVSYENVKPSGKRILITVDPTEKTDTPCFHNKRIMVYEAIYAMIRYFLNVERNVVVVAFKNTQVAHVDIGKSYSHQKAIEKLQETKGTHILPSAPFDWAASKKKQFDVFIHFLGCTWHENVPNDVKTKMSNFGDSLRTYSNKMNLPDTKLVRMCLGGFGGIKHSEDAKNLLTIVGFTPEVPRVLDAFIKGKFV